MTLTPKELRELAKACEGHTEGPFEWVECWEGVMLDTVRNVETSAVVYATSELDENDELRPILTVENPADATLLAAAPTLLSTALALVARVEELEGALADMDQRFHGAMSQMGSAFSEYDGDDLDDDTEPERTQLEATIESIMHEAWVAFANSDTCGICRDVRLARDAKGEG